MHRKKNIPSKTVIEVKNFNELKQVLDNGKGIINTVMLDNFKQTELYKAIKMLKEKRFKVEISGGINMKNFLSKQRKGIDFYSIGMLTHSYKSVDFSLEFWTKLENFIKDFFKLLAIFKGFLIDYLPKIA